MFQNRVACASLKDLVAVSACLNADMNARVQLPDDWTMLDKPLRRLIKKACTGSGSITLEATMRPGEGFPTSMATNRLVMYDRIVDVPLEPPVKHPLPEKIPGVASVRILVTSKSNNDQYMLGTPEEQAVRFERALKMATSLFPNRIVCESLDEACRINSVLDAAMVNIISHGELSDKRYKELKAATYLSMPRVVIEVTLKSTESLPTSHITSNRLVMIDGIDSVPIEPPVKFPLPRPIQYKTMRLLITSVYHGGAAQLGTREEQVMRFNKVALGNNKPFANRIQCASLADVATISACLDHVMVSVTNKGVGWKSLDKKLRVAVKAAGVNIKGPIVLETTFTVAHDVMPESVQKSRLVLCDMQDGSPLLKWPFKGPCWDKDVLRILVTCKGHPDEAKEPKQKVDTLSEAVPFPNRFKCASLSEAIEVSQHLDKDMASLVGGRLIGLTLLGRIRAAFSNGKGPIALEFTINQTEEIKWTTFGSSRQVLYSVNDEPYRVNVNNATLWSSKPMRILVTCKEHPDVSVVPPLPHDVSTRDKLLIPRTAVFNETLVGLNEFDTIVVSFPGETMSLAKALEQFTSFSFAAAVPTFEGTKEGRAPLSIIRTDDEASATITLAPNSQWRFLLTTDMSLKQTMVLLKYQAKKPVRISIKTVQAVTPVFMSRIPEEYVPMEIDMGDGIVVRPVVSETPMPQ